MKRKLNEELKFDCLRLISSFGDTQIEYIRKIILVQNTYEKDFYFDTLEVNGIPKMLVNNLNLTITINTKELIVTSLLLLKIYMLEDRNNVDKMQFKIVDLCICLTNYISSIFINVSSGAINILTIINKNYKLPVSKIELILNSVLKICLAARCTSENRLIEILHLINSVVCSVEIYTDFFLTDTLTMVSKVLCDYLRAADDLVGCRSILLTLGIIYQLINHEQGLQICMSSLDDLVPSLFIAFQLEKNITNICSIIDILRTWIINSNKQQFGRLFNACIIYDFSIFITTTEFDRQGSMSREMILSFFILLFQKSDNYQIYFLLSDNCFPVLLTAYNETCDPIQESNSIECILKVLAGFWPSQYEYNRIKCKIHESTIQKTLQIMINKTNSRTAAAEIQFMLEDSWEMLTKEN